MSSIYSSIHMSPMRALYYPLQIIIVIITICRADIIYAIDANTSSLSGLKADIVEYHSEQETIVASGNVSAILEGHQIYADKIIYDIKNDIMWAEGDIRIIDKDHKTIIGESAILKDEFKKGLINEFVANLGDGAIIAANQAKKNGANKFSLHRTSFTPCDIKCSNKPIWQIDAKETHIDYEDHTITYKNLFFDVYGVPIFYLPYFYHPTPNAPAQSGLLKPDFDTNNKQITLPFYYRAKPNLDFTITPKIAEKYKIFELEARHKIKNGAYKISTSFGNPIDIVERDGKQLKKYSNRYYIFTDGKFTKGNVNYGFDINKISDEAYLKNYYHRHDDYLESTIFLNKINHRDYFLLESKSITGLGGQKNDKSVLILPSIKANYFYGFNEDESVKLNMRNDFLSYIQSPNKKLHRGSVDLELSSDFISYYGHLLNITLSNRSDLYITDFNTQIPISQNRQEIWYRSIPELQTSLKYPFINSSSAAVGMQVEPIVMLVIGKKYHHKFNKFGLIDAGKYDLSENNIFLPNRFDGIDYHEYGNRLSYGLNSSLYNESFYIESFIGQLLHNNNTRIVNKNNAEYVGSLMGDLSDNFELFYRTRKTKAFHSIRDEIELMYNKKNFNFSSTFTSLKHISNYFICDDFAVKKNKVKQVSFDAKYQLMRTIQIFGGMRFDLEKSKIKTLDRTIGVTFFKDCVKIDMKIYWDYTQDSTRGLKAVRSTNYAVGLKFLNM